MGLSDGIGSLIGKGFRRQVLIERKQEVLVNRLTDGRMVEDQEIEPRGEVRQRHIRELLQRSLLPGDGNVGVKFREALSRGNHRKIATRVVPGNTGELEH